MRNQNQVDALELQRFPVTRISQNIHPLLQGAADADEPVVVTRSSLDHSGLRRLAGLTLQLVPGLDAFDLFGAQTELCREAVEESPLSSGDVMVIRPRELELLEVLTLLIAQDSGGRVSF